MTEMESGSDTVRPGFPGPIQARVDLLKEMEH